MVRKVFYSFHFDGDCARTSLVRNIGAISGNEPAKDNDWETVKKGGDRAIQNWIDEQMKGRECTILLVGAHTAGRKWINYEIKKSWEAGLGLFGVRVHKLNHFNEGGSIAGKNPFDEFTLDGGPAKLSSIVKLYDPGGTTSKDVYASIANNLSNWVETAIRARH